MDEAHHPDGAPRAHCAELTAALDGVELAPTARAVAALLEDRGVGFGGDDARPFVVDPVPRLIPPEDWALLSEGVAQRARALAAFVADVYGRREIVAAGAVPGRVVDSAEALEPDLAGLSPRASAWLAGLDLIRGPDGRLAVLEDNVRTPSGIAYAVAARRAVDEALGLDAPDGRLDPAPAFALLHDALAASAPDGAGDPTVVLLSDGPSNSAWYEHRAIAAAIDVPVVLPEDVSRRGDRVLARIDGAERPVDVVYRRTDEDRLRDDAGEPTWIAELLLEPLRAGTVAVVNPFGAGVADDKLAHAYVERMVRFYLGEEPLLGSVTTYDLGDPDCLDSALPRLGELVVKPRHGHGGAGVVVGPHTSEDDRAAIRREVERDPERYVAQELVELSTHPTVCDGRLEPCHVDLRPFAIGLGDAATTAPVALTRVALDPGSYVVNSSRDGGGKDTWLLT